MKLQHLHDYLLSTGLITPDQLEVWETDSTTSSKHGYDGSPEMLKTRTYTMNVLISNWTATQDRDTIEFAVLWWLNVYEPSHDTEKPRFRTEPDIQNHRVANLWIGFTVTEKTKILADGTITRCMPQNIINDGDDITLPTWVRFVNEGLELPLIDE